MRAIAIEWRDGRQPAYEVHVRFSGPGSADLASVGRGDTFAAARLAAIATLEEAARAVRALTPRDVQPIGH
ncbi:MAG TPA: hypothetical protein VGR82_17735 [Methylomirabilota bacterium]|nr:hypothetical protein [Methylomirabilota bacterium]